MTTASVGYLLSSIALLAVALIVIVGMPKSRQSYFFFSAIIISALWSGLASYHAINGYTGSLMLAGFEIVKNTIWCAFFYIILVFSTSNKNIKKVAHGLAVLVATLSLFNLFTVFYLGELFVQVGNNSIIFELHIFISFILVVIGLVFIEQVFRNVPAENRWGVKFLCLGVGAIFVYDIFMYADALLFMKIDLDIWGSRGFVNALTAPLLVVAFSRNKDWGSGVSLSRNAVFYSATIVSVGIYLTAMSLGGYYIKIYGGEWGKIAQLSFLFGAIIVLIAALFSGVVRAKMRVFVSKHFHGYRYDYREEWLKTLQLLAIEQTNNELKENAIRVIANTLESPAGALWLNRDYGYYDLVAELNMPNKVCGSLKINDSLIDFMSTWQWVIDFDEYKNNSDLYSELQMSSELIDSNIWVIVPLMHQAKLYGFVMLTQPRVKIKISWEDRDLLMMAGRQVASFMALLDANEGLAEARQFEAFNRLSAYIMHDLKNQAAQLELITKNSQKYINNHDFVKDSFETVENVVLKMNKMLAQLRKGQLDREIVEIVDFNKMLNKVVIQREGESPVPILSTDNSPLFVLTDNDRVSSVVEHIIQNAQEATDDNGKVAVRCSAKDEFVIVEVEDNGTGMDDDFIKNRLFKPFDTTKGNAGMGIGVYESREFVQSHGGKFYIKSEPDIGTTVQLWFRLAAKNKSILPSNIN